MPRPIRTRSLAVLAAVLAGVLALVSPALARGAPGRGGGGDDRPEVRAAGTCGKGASSSLKIKSRDGGIEAEFEVHRARAGSRWRVTIVHERHVAYRGLRRAAGRSRSFHVEYRLADYSGADRVTGRAVGPGGLVCVATATMPG